MAETTTTTEFQMVCPKCGSNSFTVRRDQRAYVHKSQPFELVFSCRCGKQLFGDQIQEEYDRQKAEWDALGAPAPDPVDPDEVQRQKEEDRRKEQLRRAMEYRRKYLAEKRKEKLEEEERRREEEDRRWREKVARVEAEQRGGRAAAARSAANGGKAISSKRAPSGPPPKAKKAPEPKPPPRPSPKPAAPPPEPEKKPPVAKAAPSAADLDPNHPHAEFMPYLLRGDFGDLFPEAMPPDEKPEDLCIWPPCEKKRRKKSKYCSRECSNKNARWRHKMRKRDGE